MRRYAYVIDVNTKVLVGYVSSAARARDAVKGNRDRAQIRDAAALTGLSPETLAALHNSIVDGRVASAMDDMDDIADRVFAAYESLADCPEVDA